MRSIIKKTINFLNKIWIIIKSKFRNKDKMLKHDWYKKRIESCSKCEFNSKFHKDEIENNIKEKVIWLANQKKDYCFICKCAIVDKASEELEECSNKENKKWESL